MPVELGDVLERLREHGLRCSVSPGELLAYIQGPSYEDDRVTLEEILGEGLLLPHEAAETCILKSMGYRITRGYHYGGVPRHLPGPPSSPGYRTR